MAIIDDFKTRFPEFDSTTVDSRLPAIVDVYRCYYDWDYTNCNKETILQLLAHLFVESTSDSSSATRAESSKSVGSVSVSFDNVSGSESVRRNWLRGTKYGVAFLSLIAHKTGGFFV